MSLTILTVAYPFAPVGPDAVGGAEQVASQLDEALVRSGQRSIIIACEGSVAAGIHIPVPRVSAPLSQGRICAARRRHACAIADALERWPIDVIHLHGVDFQAYLPPHDVPTLATLHLPADWYTVDVFRSSATNLWFNCVSRHQRAKFSSSLPILATIENGVAARFFTARHAKRDFALMLARICPEKGVHLALDAAKRAGIPLLVAGEVFPYETHLRYFAEQVAPRLDSKRRFIGPVGLARKRRLLAAARCVLIPSLVDETASLVAREALACGTPVIAFIRGALIDTIDHGRTGFLVRNADEMAMAIPDTAELDPADCRAAARERFSLVHMTQQYFAAYERLKMTRSDHANEPALGAA